MLPTTTEIVIAPETFESFECWSGWVPAGYWANWLGVLTPAYVWAFPEEVLAIYSARRHEQFRYPADGEHVLDWVPLLEAILAAKDTFVMVALGAGWGRWLSAGAFGAKQRDLRYKLVGVEAEPQHFHWMETHFRENRIDTGSFRLLNAAVSDRSGACWFYVGKPDSWYGQCIVPEEDVSLPEAQPVALGYETAYGDERIRRIACVDMQDVIGDLPYVDYLHMDIQGTEYDFLAAYPQLLGERVRMVNIGTHSPEIERKLRDFFTHIGWTSRYDVPINSQIPVRLGGDQANEVQFGDGIQVWVNPQLSER